MKSRDDILGGAHDGESIGFKRHLVLPSLLFLLLEAAGVVYPVWSLFSPHVRDPGNLARLVLPMYVLAQLLWLGILWHWVAPVYRLVTAKRQGLGISDVLRARARAATWKTPLRALSLRGGLWFLVFVGHGAVLHANEAWPMERVAQFVAMGTTHAVICNIGRAVWLHSLLGRLRARLTPTDDGLSDFSQGYRLALLLANVVCIGGTLGAIAAFIYFFIPLTGEQYTSLQLEFPLAFVVATMGLWLQTRFSSRTIDSYLRAQSDEKRGDKQATNVYRGAQSLPYRLALAHWLLWVLIGVRAGFLSKWRNDTDDGVLIFGTISVIAIGSSLYQALWHRQIVRPLLDHVTLKHRLPVRGIRTALSLRGKLLVAFGGMVLFSVGLALFWGFIQYKNLVTKYTVSRAELGLAWVRSEVQGAMAAREEMPSPRAVEEVLQTLASEGEDPSAVFFFFGKGYDEVFATGGGHLGTPKLPWYAVAAMQLPKDAAISLGALSLTGRRGPLRVVWHGKQYDLGGLAVFYPSYRGRGPSLVRPLRELLLFFLVLFAVCAGIVVVTVAQFVKPVRRLENHADSMARGELTEPVSSGGEGDEIGRLTFALEEMRRALRDKLRTSEELNQDLERAVERRTADLAKKNRELAETLEKLTRAHDQLVQSEKMASIGQLVAGIAHEINNPVNAIVNTVGPLGQAIVDLDGESPELRAEAAEDVQDMIRVVQRGAERTKAIVQALHNYSRTDEESVVEIDLNRSLDDSLELLRHILKGNIRVTRSYGEVGRIVGHAGQLNQVFMNLLTNAAQAVSGRDNAEVTVSTSRISDDQVAVDIGDNGEGMTSEVIGRIFDPFFTTKEVGQGSGLGLSIVHQIVERHQGTISVSSELGVGTTFRVILPKGDGVAVVHGSPFDTLP